MSSIFKTSIFIFAVLFSCTSVGSSEVSVASSPEFSPTSAIVPMEKVVDEECNCGQGSCTFFLGPKGMCEPGDLNGDGVPFTDCDIWLFTRAISLGINLQCADFNGDFQVNLLDVDPFYEAMMCYLKGKSGSKR